MAQQLPPPHRTSIRPLQAFQQAITFHDQGRLWEAAQLYESVLKADDRHFGAVYRLGLIRLQQNKFDDAVRLFRCAVKIDRKSADAHHYLGFALTALGRCEEAIRSYEKALVIRPGVPEAHNNLGHALQVIGRFDEAIAQYEKALAIRPAYAEALNNLGNTLHLLSRSEEAIAQYEKALAIRPVYAEAHWNLGNALRALGRSEESISHFKKAIAIRPNYAEAHNSLGNELHMADRSEQAIPHYEKALAIRPDYADAHFNLGVALWALGRHEEAIPHYERVFLIQPKYVEALDTCDQLTALLALSNLPGSVVKIDVLARLDQLARDNSRDSVEFENLAPFIRAKVFDKSGRHGEAWEALKPANRRLFLAGQEEFDEMNARRRTTLARVKDDPATAAPGTIVGGTISLFILGPSRSGKTTMEQLVSTLEGVKRGYENVIVEETVRQTCERVGLPASTWLEDVPLAFHQFCREAYLEELGMRASSARVFTNTNPRRIHDADLMAGTFPNARFLFVKRDLEDNALRIYMERYRIGNTYAYDLKAARNHVVWYHEMMDLLATRLPASVRVIHYEDMVADPAAALSAAADLCGVPMTNRPLPALGDDRACSVPYRRFMGAELEG